MNLAILGATGDVGGALLNEALDRGHAVTACARHTAPLAVHGDRIHAEYLDVARDGEALARLLADLDAVISALRPPPGAEPALVPLTRTVLEAARAAGVPAYITGGAATLKLGDGTDHTVLSAPGFLPEAVRPIAEACAAQDALLNCFPDVAWTCLRPPAMLVKGARTGRYALGRDALVMDTSRESRVSLADFAVAMLDLVELRPAPGQRLTVGW